MTSPSNPNPSHTTDEEPSQQSSRLKIKIDLVQEILAILENVLKLVKTRKDKLEAVNAARIQNGTRTAESTIKYENTMMMAKQLIKLIGDAFNQYCAFDNVLRTVEENQPIRANVVLLFPDLSRLDKVIENFQRDRWTDWNKIRHQVSALNSETNVINGDSSVPIVSRLFQVKFSTLGPSDNATRSHQTGFNGSQYTHSVGKRPRIEDLLNPSEKFLRLSCSKTDVEASAAIRGDPWSLVRSLCDTQGREIIDVIDFGLSDENRIPNQAESQISQENFVHATINQNQNGNFVPSDCTHPTTWPSSSNITASVIAPLVHPETVGLPPPSAPSFTSQHTSINNNEFHNANVINAQRYNSSTSAPLNNSSNQPESSYTTNSSTGVNISNYYNINYSQPPNSSIISILQNEFGSNSNIYTNTIHSNNNITVFDQGNRASSYISQNSNMHLNHLSGNISQTPQQQFNCNTNSHGQFTSDKYRTLPFKGNDVFNSHSSFNNSESFQNSVDQFYSQHVDPNRVLRPNNGIMVSQTQMIQLGEEQVQVPNLNVNANEATHINQFLCGNNSLNPGEREISGIYSNNNIRPSVIQKSPRKTPTQENSSPALTSDSTLFSDIQDLLDITANASSRAAIPEVVDITANEDGEDDEFEKLNLKTLVLSGIKYWGFSKPMPIQMEGIKALTKRKDAIIQSGSSSGKTTLAMISIVQIVDESSNASQAIILTASVENSLHIHERISSICAFTNIKTLCVDKMITTTSTQGRSKESGQVIVGIPENVLVFLKNNNFRTETVNALIIDSADELLENGRATSIIQILYVLNGDAQVAMIVQNKTEAVTAFSRRLRNPIDIESQEEKEQNIRPEPQTLSIIDVNEKSTYDMHVECAEEKDKDLKSSEPKLLLPSSISGAHNKFHNDLNMEYAETTETDMSPKCQSPCSVIEAREESPCSMYIDYMEAKDKQDTTSEPRSPSPISEVFEESPYISESITTDEATKDSNSHSRTSEIVYVKPKYIFKVKSIMKHCSIVEVTAQLPNGEEVELELQSDQALLDEDECEQLDPEDDPLDIPEPAMEDNNNENELDPLELERRIKCQSALLRKPNLRAVFPDDFAKTFPSVFIKCKKIDEEQPKSYPIAKILHKVEHKEERTGDRTLADRTEFLNKKHFYIIIDEEDVKIDILSQLNMEQERAIIFCNSCEKAEWLSTKLRQKSMFPQVLHKYTSKKEKDTILKTFEMGICRLLISTDNTLTKDASLNYAVPLVVNFDMPNIPLNYFWRSGYATQSVAAPSLKTIMVVSFIQQNNLPLIYHIEKTYGIKILAMMEDRSPSRASSVSSTVEIDFECPD